MNKIIKTGLTAITVFALSAGMVFAAESRPFTPADLSLVPAECSAITFSRIIIGGNSKDSINGTNGNDLILGNGGNDAINGLGGNDCIVGGDGSDSISGYTGNDVLLGGNGDDIMAGQDGNDKLIGGSGNDVVSGGAGTNSCSAEVMGWGC